MTMNLDPTKLAEAWADPNTRRMTLGAVREVHGESSRKLAKALGMSIFHYQDIELGRRPLSEEGFIKAMQYLGVTPEYLAKALLAMHQLLMEVADGWPKVWREQLEPLDFDTRRDLILADKDLQNSGLGNLLCDKSLEVADPEEAVRLAGLALLTMEASGQLPEYKRRLCGYARGHLGHALLRRGDSESAEVAFALAIEEWMTGKGGPPDDERQVERLASIVPGFPKAEALRKPKRTRKPHKNRSKGKA
jgi:transcriptional regulator with XRE-family HTH domain